jgi:hypothetical protein
MCSCCRVDFNTQQLGSGGAGSEGDARAQRLKDAVAAIFAVSGAQRSMSMLVMCTVHASMPHAKHALLALVQA